MKRKGCVRLPVSKQNLNVLSNSAMFFPSGEIEDMLGFLLDSHDVNATGAIASIVKKGRSYMSFHIQTHWTGFHNNTPQGLVNPVKWGDSQSSLITNLARQNQNIKDFLGPHHLHYPTPLLSPAIKNGHNEKKLNRVCSVLKVGRLG